MQKARIYWVAESMTEIRSQTKPVPKLSRLDLEFCVQTADWKAKGTEGKRRRCFEDKFRRELLKMERWSPLRVHAVLQEPARAPQSSSAVVTRRGGRRKRCARCPSRRERKQGGAGEGVRTGSGTRSSVRAAASKRLPGY